MVGIVGILSVCIGVADDNGVPVLTTELEAIAIGAPKVVPLAVIGWAVAWDVAGTMGLFFGAAKSTGRSWGAAKA